MKKQTSTAFNKKIYLLGKDTDNIYYWLEEASWDCSWYWGFGYVETYTANKHPSNSRDIISHQHIDSSFLGEGNSKNDDYCHNLFDAKLLKETTFTEEEGWELSELFKQYYLLRETAEYFNRGKANVSNTTIPDFKKPDLVKEINETRLPIIFKRIYEILTPIRD